ncbi:hypothetical protein EV178_001366 [Coemansia sp. RSA 1646]|nr:hypothetical protein EV178_001366 [Coemansia sp. RSA 1646]KAJ1772883.1 hypothetical protein LPJ74_001021 [Coemansia sp. RSA 1843]KAJ2217264.1 hypothetical protein EV179_000731 [Coemansia sp. RSA 487]
MSSHRKYSLWLCPLAGSSAQAHLSGIITHYTKTLGAPLFSPHATLFSPVIASSDGDALAQVRDYVAKLHGELCKETLRVGIPFKASSVATGCKYHQCVLLEEQGNPALALANGIARQHWNATNQLDFYPHASLVYGDYTSAKREEIAADVNSKLPEDIEQLSFFAPEIHVVQTTGPCEEWRDIGSIYLSG